MKIMDMHCDTISELMDRGGGLRKRGTGDTVGSYHTSGETYHRRWRHRSPAAIVGAIKNSRLYRKPAG